jgi:hypothetical protein
VTPRMLRLLALWIGCLSSVGLVLSFLALSDISRGEADVLWEWMVLRLALGASIAFHIAALTALSRLQP